jgi:hypothetical protein
LNTLIWPDCLNIFLSLIPLLHIPAALAVNAYEVGMDSGGRWMSASAVGFEYLAVGQD